MNLKAALHVYKRRYGPLEVHQGPNLVRIVEDIYARTIPTHQKAFLLANIMVDTNHLFVPIIERATPSYYKPLQNQLGNANLKEAFKYRPRGYTRVAGKKAYEAIKERYAVDVVQRPDLLCKDEALAYKVATDGLLEGVITGRALDEFTKEGVVDVAAAREHCVSLGDRVKPVVEGTEVWEKAFYQAANAKPEKKQVSVKKP